ncbi:MAG: polysaccharide biosynthesis tyrosine autokinase, partial [Bacteroidales bacterium]|nr:polysaccharide biosynthesis tyrosine autokinase [Bacteroidales bacterium]
MNNQYPTPPTPQQGAYGTSPFEEDSLDLKKYFFLILANWYWFIISLFLGLAIAYMTNRYSKPVYRVNATLMLNEGASSRGLSGVENLIPGMEMYSQRRYAINEVEILKSYSMAQKTLMELDFDVSYTGIGRSGLKEVVLYKNSPFYVEIDSVKGSLGGHPVEIHPLSQTHYELYIDDQYEIRQKMAYGETFHSEPFNFTLHLKNPENYSGGYGKYVFVVNGVSGLSYYYKNRLTISSNDERRGGVLYLNITDFNSQQATDYLNKLMTVYIKQGLEEKNQTVTNSIEFIDDQLGIIDDSLRITESNLQKFYIANSLIDISSEGAQIYEKLNNYEKVQSELELKSRYYNYLLNYVNDKTNENEVLAPASLGLGDALLNSLITQLNEQILERNLLSYSASKENLQFEMVESKIRNTKVALLENIEELIKNNDGEKKEVEEKLGFAEKDLLSLPVTERQLISIERNYKVNDRIYTFLLERRAEAAIAKASNVADNKILDYANSNTAARISPNTRTNYMLGLIGGIGLPLALLIIIELSNNKITGRNDIEKKTNIPIIAHIGHSTLGDVPVFEAPGSSLSESFRGLRTNLQYLLREKDQKVISISSTITGEGKTFVSLNLATIFAMAGKKTLLVGLDLRKPKLHKVFNINNETGLSSYMIGKTTYSEVIKETKVDNLFMISSGPVPPNPAELLDTPVILDFIHKARKDFDIVILDTPPYGVVTDALLVGRHADANLFIIRQNYTERDALELMNEIQ